VNSPAGSALVSRGLPSVPAVDPGGFSVVAQRRVLRLPAGDLPTAAARHHPADSGPTAVSLTYTAHDYEAGSLCIVYFILFSQSNQIQDNIILYNIQKRKTGKV